MSGSRSKVIKSKRKKYYFVTKASSNKQMFDVILIGESISLISLMIKAPSSSLTRQIFYVTKNMIEIKNKCNAYYLCEKRWA